MVVVLASLRYCDKTFYIRNVQNTFQMRLIAWLSRHRQLYLHSATDNNKTRVGTKHLADHAFRTRKVGQSVSLPGRDKSMIALEK